VHRLEKPGIGRSEADLSYLPLGFLIVFAILVPVLLLGLQRLLSPRRPSAAKLSTYECGAPVLGRAQQRLPIKFYVVAVLFLIFDIETVFLFPWSVLFRQLGLFGLIEMGVFLGVLVVGLVYVWRKGALEWE
jgi:NADH-quinone oxidoreductase subunit A